MFDLMHEMRTRIITSPSFNGDRILGAILFENTMDREIEGSGTADYLWNVKQVVPFLKVDKGLADEADGVQIMKPMPGLDDAAARAWARACSAPRCARSSSWPTTPGVEGGRRPAVRGRPPDPRPPASCRSSSPRSTSTARRRPRPRRCSRPPSSTQLDAARRRPAVMLKLTLPETRRPLRRLVDHPNVLRVVALSGGYSRDEANARLARNHGVIASFSRALTEGLSAQQSDDEFDATLDESIASIYAPPSPDAAAQEPRMNRGTGRRAGRRRGCLRRRRRPTGVAFLPTCMAAVTNRPPLVPTEVATRTRGMLRWMTPPPRC